LELLTATTPVAELVLYVLFGSSLCCLEGNRGVLWTSPFENSPNSRIRLQVRLGGIRVLRGTG